MVLSPVRRDGDGFGLAMVDWPDPEFVFDADVFRFELRQQRLHFIFGSLSGEGELLEQLTLTLSRGDTDQFLQASSEFIKQFDELIAELPELDSALFPHGPALSKPARFHANVVRAARRGEVIQMDFFHVNYHSLALAIRGDSETVSVAPTATVILGVPVFKAILDKARNPA